jgi:heme/copper-type cytochrome/quinol oxidase subunit 2
MLRLFVLLQITRLRAEHHVRSARSERGSVTVEHVLWAVAVIAIVAIVVAAVKAYVTSQSGKLK